MAILHNDKYKKIYKIEVVYNNNVPFANIMLEVYKDENSRLKTKSGEEYLVLGYENVDIQDISIIDEENILECFYKKIKQKEDYATAIDC